ncbi:sulfite exporter TauE/SafE family protein [Desulfovibrio mangrovi]|uniref:sulfite exporter TauE/SafE family protein n=1 Tax=Desulfovibrio mangrovi TaxID=2976983 RepID=UPI002247264F|nr:sulfite exporter TauE/SafE family protein [Desulfovibrio mangrovi]UZP67130.1 sulfite exporter TauE/SafE family protein [Desulfovibrio mangrovi]
MEFDQIFLIALQSSLFLGLIHGVNPCGHSWLVLAPFVYGERNGARVFSLTAAFIIGTSLACLAIGLTLGAISMSLPPDIKHITDLVTAGVLVVLGLILVVKPELLHSHAHDHDHGHGHCDHGHEHHTEACCADHAHSPHEHDEHHHGHVHEAPCNCGHHEHEHVNEHVHEHQHDHAHARKGHHHTHGHGGCGCAHGPKLRSVTFWGLFVFGFMNMIVPCPTVAIMYSYALDSGDAFKSTAVFASYALGTAIALAAVIYAIYKVANAMRALERPWLEPLIMRVAGLLTAAFGVYSYLVDAGYL